VALLVVDEAARVDDSLYQAIRPMLAASRGKLVCLSSAWARRGWFYDAWQQSVGSWDRVNIMASQCSRIDPAFLEEERQALGERIYQREYECVFSTGDDAAFDYDSVMAALTAGSEEPLF